jgi:hypothetical protein
MEKFVQKGFDGAVSALFLGPLLSWLPVVFFITLLLVAFLFYFRKRFSFAINRNLVILAVSFRMLYAAFLTIGQYLIWSENAFTKSFLDAPLGASIPVPMIQKLPWLFDSRLGYFLFYSWGRFWLNVVLSVGIAWVFWFFLKLLKKYRERFFEEGEMELGFLCCLIVGWPQVVIFVPLVFVLVVLISVFRSLFLKESYTTLGYPFLTAAFLTFLIGGGLIELFNLGVLKI